MKNLILFTAIGATLAASPAIAKKREVPAATTTGAAVDCIPISQIRESRVRSDSVIDFRTAGNKWYRNTLPNSCPALGFEERFSYRTSLNQLCAVDKLSLAWNARNNPTLPTHEYFSATTGTEGRASRSKNNCEIRQSALTTIGQSNLPYTAIRLWNKSDSEIRSCTHRKLPKAAIKKFAKSLPI